MSCYEIWYHHEEQMGYGSTSEPHTVDKLDEPSADVDYDLDTFSPSMVEEGDRWEKPNLKYMLDTTKKVLYKGCKYDNSPLLYASRLMAIKTDYILAEKCMDVIAGFVRDIIPEENLAPTRYIKF